MIRKGFSGHRQELTTEVLLSKAFPNARSSCHLVPKCIRSLKHQTSSSKFVVVPRQSLLISAAFRILGKHPCLPNGKRAECGGENAKGWAGLKDNE